MPDPQISQIIFQTLLAVGLGMAIGIEREHRKKSAGLRTFTLVCLGSTIFTILSVSGFKEFIGVSSYDPSRIASQVVIGIGFIGAGLIFIREDKILGLTTAAGIWTTAAIGVAVGLKFYFMAVFATAVVLLVLWLLRAIEEKVPRIKKEGSPSKQHDSTLS